MPEESGTMIIKPNDEIIILFNSADTIEEALIAFAQQAEIRADIFGGKLPDKVNVNSGYVELRYEIGEWVEISKEFTLKGKNIEYYSHHSDEYGTHNLFLNDNKGLSIHVFFEESSDINEYEDYQKKITEEIENWNNAVPEVVAQLFPGFEAVETELYIY